MPRKSASSHRTKSSKINTKHKSKDKKEEINLLMINNKLIYTKMKPKDFGINEIRKRIKDVKMKKEIDFHLESEILEIEMLWQMICFCTTN